MQGTSSWLWRFNLLFLRLLGEISLSLPCLHSSWGSALDLDPPLRVGRLRVSVLRSDRTGLKEQPNRGLCLNQAGGREGYRMRGEPVVAEACVMLQQPEACWVFSQWSCPCITGPWQWWAAQAPGREGMDSDLCSHTRLLGGCSSSLSNSCLSLVSVLLATACTHLWNSFRQCSESPLTSHPETMVSCLLGSSRLFPGLPPS